MTEQITWNSKNLLLTINESEIKISFSYFIFSSKIATIYEKQKEQWNKVGEVRKKYEKFITIGNKCLLPTTFKNQKYTVRKEKGFYLLLNNQHDLKLEMMSGKDSGTDIFIKLSDKVIGKVIYPKTHFLKSKILIEIEHDLSPKLIDLIKIIIISISANRWSNGVVTDSGSPIDNESLW